jgi:hypothetical protein
MKIYRLGRSGCLIYAWAFLAHFATAATTKSLQELPAPLSERELVELRDLSGLAVSPDGSHAVVRVDQPDVDSNRTNLTWYRISLNGLTQPMRIADGGDATWNVNGGLENGIPVWSPDSVWIYFRALHGEAMQVWRARADGSAVEQVTHDAANVESFLLDAPIERMYYVVGATRLEIKKAEQLEYDSGVLLDEAVIPGYPIARTFPVDGRLSMFRHIHGNQEGGARAGLLSDTPKRIFVVNLASLEVRAANEQDATNYRGNADGSGQTPRSLLSKLLAPDGNGLVQLVETHSDGTARSAPIERLQYEPASPSSKMVTCADPACTGNTPRLKLMGWHDKQTIIFTNSDSSGQSLYTWNVTSNRIQRITSTFGVMGIDRYGEGTCPVVREVAICVSSTAGQPPRLESIALRTGQTRIIFDPNPTITTDRLGSVERLRVTDESGDEGTAFLILPRGNMPARRWPLVITSYQCDGFLRGGSGDDVPEHVLAGIGIAAVCLADNAGAKRRPPERSGLPIEMVYGEASLRLRKAVVALLDGRGLIDRRRVALSGLSAGATETLYAISHSKLFAAAIITTPGYDDPIETYFYGATDLARKRVGAGQSQFPYVDPSYWKLFSPALNAEAIHTPLLMQLSDTEYLLAMELYSHLRDVDAPVEMFVYPDEYHLKHQPRHRLAVYHKSVAWMLFWLQGYERKDTTPSTPQAEQLLSEQYRRWEQLCGIQRSENPGRPTFCLGTKH